MTKKCFNILELRFAAIRRYGGKCIRCGYSDWRGLTFDHVNGGGTNSGTCSYYDIIISDGKGIFQLLCANCNQIKRYENNECKARRETSNARYLTAMKEWEERNGFEQNSSSGPEPNASLARRPGGQSIQ